MKSSLLPKPLDFSECKDLAAQEECAYKYFCTNIMDDKIRGRFNHNFIELNKELEYIDGKEQIFTHLCGFGEDKFNIDPCINSDVEILCKVNCQDDCIPINQRNLCLYRARTLTWFNCVLELASFNNENIKIWEIDKKLKIRFTHETADYIIIINKFFSVKKNRYHYKLITAYPLFLKGDRKKADKEYTKYKKSVEK